MAIQLYRLNFFDKSSDRWSLFQSALLLASFCSTEDCCNANKVSQFQYTEIVTTVLKMMQLRRQSSGIAIVVHSDILHGSWFKLTVLVSFLTRSLWAISAVRWSKV